MTIYRDKFDEAIDELASKHPEMVGNTEEALHLIILLIDQFGADLRTQRRIEDILQEAL